VKLIEALELLKRPVPEGASPFKACLACGFTPLHLETFLAAHLCLLYPEARIEITTGPYGDLAGTLESITPAGLEAVAVAVEWADLDPRLGIRALGGWRAADASDIVGSARKAALRIGGILGKLASSVPVCVCFPTLPLPPLFIDRPEQCGIHELELREIVASLASTAAGERGVRVVNHQLLEEISPSGERFDIGSELATGFPWTISHASRVAELMAAIIRNPVPKKGLITDLDDTLWAGILGEVGVENLAWDMDRQAQTHGLYQQLLASLASAGILIGVASKNDPDLVEKAFARPDLLLPRENVFPFEVHWDRKSGSVRRILETWNVGPETVVFIDDSPMELAEVDAAFPAMECLLFPKNDPKAFWELLKHLRRIFGKSAVTDEDLLRLRSIRTASPFRSRSSDAVGSQDDFLREAEAGILFTMGRRPGDARALELVNKTNQFNLNGRRWTDAAWAAHFRRPEAFLLTATYEDKFGPLGKIAALLGRRDGRSLVIDAWVMSCRAFSRRIEHQCLKYLFDKTGVEEIIFDFVITPRNGPLREFFGPWLSGPPSEPFSLSKGSFFEKLPALFHEITEDADG
jgi:FkbH-like protein